MSKDQLTRVPLSDEGQDRAILLLAAAEELGYDPGVVTTDTSGTGMAFHAPADVVAKAFGKSHKFETVEEASNPEGQQVESPGDVPEVNVGGTGPALVQPPDAAGDPHPDDPAAKKAAAKKAPAKKAAKRPARKTAAKKAAAPKAEKKG